MAVPFTIILDLVLALRYNEVRIHSMVVISQNVAMITRFLRINKLITIDQNSVRAVVAMDMLIQASRDLR